MIVVEVHDEFCGFSVAFVPVQRSQYKVKKLPSLECAAVCSHVGRNRGFRPACHPQEIYRHQAQSAAIADKRLRKNKQVLLARTHARRES